MPYTGSIFEGVREVLVGALGVDDDEVIPDAVLEDDLGAESIDALDITFRLEKLFGIKIPRDEIRAAFLEASHLVGADEESGLTIFVNAKVQDVVNFVDAKLRGVTVSQHIPRRQLMP